MFFISISSTLAIKTPTIEESPSTVFVEKKHFANIKSPLASQERQKYDPITFIILKKLIELKIGTNLI